MIATTKSDFEIFLPPAAALRVAIGLWIAGLALAVVAAVRMHHPAPMIHDHYETFITSVTTAPEPAAPATEENGVVVFPQDDIYAHRTPSAGAALKQKP